MKPNPKLLVHLIYILMLIIGNTVKHFTPELASFVHPRLGSNIGSIVILPKIHRAFGDLFLQSDLIVLFLSTATVNDIEIVDKINPTSIKNGQIINGSRL